MLLFIKSLAAKKKKKFLKIKPSKKRKLSIFFVEIITMIDTREKRKYRKIFFQIFQFH